MAGLENFVLNLLKKKLIEVTGKKIIKGKVPFESDFPQTIKYIKKGKKKQYFNIYSAFNKNKKGIVAGISLFLAFLMLLGVLGQFAY